MSKKIVLALCALFLVTTTPALADDGDRRGRGNHWAQDDDDRRWQKAHAKFHKKAQQHAHKKHHKGHPVTWHKARRWHPSDRHAHRHDHGRGVGHYHYQGRGLGHVKHAPVHRHRHDRRQVRHDDWALYAILALQIVDVLNESQRDSFAYAQQRAVSVPIGETIYWNDGGARGSVVPLRDGSDRAGRYCREFQKEVVIGNRRQSSYGVACRQPDGDWEIVS